MEGLPLAEGIRGELLRIASLLVLDRLDRGRHGRVRMFIERLGKTGIEHPYGFWFERRGDVGDSAMFLCCTSPTGTSLWSDRHGYDVSIGSEVPSGLLPLQSCHRAPGSKPEHASGPARDGKKEGAKRRSSARGVTFR